MEREQNFIFWVREKTNIIFNFMEHIGIKIFILR